MIPLVPHERLMSPQINFYSYQTPSDRLYVSVVKLKTRELVNLVKYGLAHLRKVDDVTDLVSCHVVKMMPLELRLLFDPSRDVI